MEQNENQVVHNGKKKVSKEKLTPENLPFKCFRCGACCMLIGNADICPQMVTKHSNCIYFDKKNKLCRIYEDRPFECNVAELYSHAKDEGSELSWYDYVQINMAACVVLRRTCGIPEPSDSPFKGKEDQAIEFFNNNMSRIS